MNRSVEPTQSDFNNQEDQFSQGCLSEDSRILREYAQYLINTNPSVIPDDDIIELEELLKKVKNTIPISNELRKRVNKILGVVSYLVNVINKTHKSNPKPYEFFERLSEVLEELNVIVDLIE